MTKAVEEECSRMEEVKQKFNKAKKYEARVLRETDILAKLDKESQSEANYQKLKVIALEMSSSVLRNIF